MKENSIFRFKQFSVYHNNSTMKVGTDAVLLGAWVNVSNSKSILEVGTGCGIVSLMLAQRSKAKIMAIDIDKPSVIEANTNFQNSSWTNRILACNISIEEYSTANIQKYDLIVSNPPFFDNSHFTPDERRNQARHTSSLSFEDLVKYSSHLLPETGILSLIIPYVETQKIVSIAEKHQLYPQRQCFVKNKQNSEYKRTLIEFSAYKAANKESELIIRNPDGSFSKDYQKLTIDFHPHFN